jgi:hypothetical protein
MLRKLEDGAIRVYVMYSTALIRRTPDNRISISEASNPAIVGSDTPKEQIDYYIQFLQEIREAISLLEEDTVQTLEPEEDISNYNFYQDDLNFDSWRENR